MLVIWIGCLVLKFREPSRRVGKHLTKVACGWFIEAILSAFGWTIGHVKVLSAALFMVL